MRVQFGSADLQGVDRFSCLLPGVRGFAAQIVGGDSGDDVRRKAKLVGRQSVQSLTQSPRKRLLRLTKALARAISSRALRAKLCKGILGPSGPTLLYSQSLAPIEAWHVRNVSSLLSLSIVVDLCSGG